VSYAEAIQFLSSLQIFGASLGLQDTFRLAELAGNPQNALRFIHVAGTNGKGSTCAMLESIYRAAGLRVGLYTSPHLVSFRERIQVNRELISEYEVTRLASEARHWLAEFSPAEHPTFFELVTVVALRYFAEKRCDLVVWETGLGGRLDATNIVMPLASVITNVQFDHEKWLGSTLEEIAREKAGIIKPRVPVITASEGTALEVIRRIAQDSLAPLHVISDAQSEMSDAVARGLRGEHQKTNAALAEKTAHVLRDAVPVSDDVITKGLRSVQWPGRFQIVRCGDQTLILDGAHNPAGAEALAKTLRAEFNDAPLAFIVGVLEDKDWKSIMSTFARCAEQMVCVPVASGRTALPVMLARAAQGENPNLTIYSVASLTEALSVTRDAAFVVVTGSLYLVGEAMELLGLSTVSGERQLNEWAARR
jgi:dihydrofolate synthase/folylpolyglutamate synthase